MSEMTDLQIRRDIYQHLNPEKEEIRLLKLLDAESSADQVQCNLQVTSLSDPGRSPYIALSYTWGDPADCEAISLNGKQIQVPCNLALALKTLRDVIVPDLKARYTDENSEDEHEFQPLRLWADAVCIDQTSVLEKNSQLPLMSKIYQSAFWVVSWLGAGNAGISQVFHYLAGAAEELTGTLQEGRDTSWIQTWPDNADFWLTMLEMESLDYWKRTWVVQELVMARSYPILTTAHSGAMQLSLGTLNQWFLFADLVRHGKIQAAEYWPLYMRAWLYSGHSTAATTTRIVSQLRHHVHTATSDEEVKPRLLDLQFFRFFTSHLASNPKDKIYGLMGILDIGVRVDYSEEFSTQELYSQFACQYMRKNSTALLACGGCGWVTSPMRGLPSWAPDWQAISRTPGNGASLYMASDNLIDVPTSAADHEMSRLRPTLAGSSPVSTFQVLDRFRLLMTGCVMGRIETARPPLQRLPILWLADLIFPIFSTLVGHRNASRIPLLSTLMFTLLRGRDPRGLKAYLYDDLAETAELARLFMLLLFGLDAPQKSEAEACRRAQELGFNPESENFAQFFRSQFFPPCLVAGRSDADWAKMDWPWQSLLTDIKFNSDSALVLSDALRENLVKHAIAWTYSGLVAVAPPYTRSGDIIAVVDGCSFPVILRKMDHSNFALVGGCYVLGLMAGEAAKLCEKGTARLEEFTII